jgi:hypothetical protein
MPANQEPKPEDSIKDQAAVPDLEVTTEELELGDSENVLAGHPIGTYMAGWGRAPAE